MTHLGDITKINGGEIEPVDCITFGSPCQDLSIAGQRAGLVGERSGLFLEAVRIIKEMREATYGKYPTFAVWENVPGAFSSNKGEDFREVLEVLARISYPAADVPRPPKGKWRTSGAIVGDGWSLAWRTHDAQFWGVPQRRRRISVVVDFGGDRASKILFDRRGLPGDSQKSGAAGQGVAAGIERSAGISGRALPGDHPGTGSGLGAVHSSVTAFSFIQNAGERAGNIGYSKEVCPTMKADGKSVGVLCLNDQGGGVMDCSVDVAGSLRAQEHGHQPCVYENHCQDSRIVGPLDISPTVARKWGTGGNNTPLVISGLDCRNAKESGISLNCINPVRIGRYVRRLTPVECERLQGYPDGWTDIGPWTDSKGKWHKESNDTARYTVLGNSIALPFWLWLTTRIAKYLPAGATLGSLFDGIGGFPLCWETVHGKGTARWASEIEEFPIAVTRRQIGKEWR